MREFHLFGVADHSDEDALLVDAIHNDAGYHRLRRLLASQYNRDNQVPDIQVYRYDHSGDRSLTLRHRQHRGRPLDNEASEVLKHVARLWGFNVRLETVDEKDRLMTTQEQTPPGIPNTLSLVWVGETPLGGGGRPPALAASARPPLPSRVFARTPNAQTRAGRRSAPRPPRRPALRGRN